MTTTPCPHTWQVEAVVDDRLGENAADGLARHLRGCAACRQHYEALTRIRRLAEALPTREPDELGWRRLRESILRQASGWQPTTGRSRARRDFRAPLVAALLASTTIALGAIGALALLPKGDAERSPTLGGPIPRATPTLMAGKDSRAMQGQVAPPRASATASTDSFHVVSPPDSALAPVDPLPRPARVTRVSKEARPELDEPPKPSTGLLFVEAMRSFSAGAYVTAERQLADFVAQSPSDSRAEDAAYLMVVCCQRRGDSACASRRAAEYIARFPNGLRSSQVRRALEQ